MMIAAVIHRILTSTACQRAKPIAALAACELASLAVTRGASMHLALRAACGLRKTAVLPFCPSTHSYDLHGRRECRRCMEHSPADLHGRRECRRCMEHSPAGLHGCRECRCRTERSPAGHGFYWELLLHSQYFRHPWRSQSRAARSCGSVVAIAYPDRSTMQLIERRAYRATLSASSAAEAWARLLTDSPSSAIPSRSADL
jgi:hypothetical protein